MTKEELKEAVLAELTKSCPLSRVIDSSNIICPDDPDMKSVDIRQSLSGMQGKTGTFSTISFFDVYQVVIVTAAKLLGSDPYDTPGCDEMMLDPVTSEIETQLGLAGKVFIATDESDPYYDEDSVGIWFNQTA